MTEVLQPGGLRMGRLVTDALEGWKRLSPDEPAIVFDGHDVVTFKEVDEWTDNAAHVVKKLGISKGDRVGILGNNSLEWIVAGIGALKAGAVVVPLNERFVADELAYMVQSTEASIILHDEPSRKEAEGTATILGTRLSSLEGFASLRPSVYGHTPFEQPTIDSGSPAFLIFTSGTSAMPKAAIYTHDNVMSMMLENGIFNPILRPGARWIYVLGMSGAAGLPWNVLQSLNRGCVLYYETGFDPQVTLRRLAEEKIANFSGVPLLYEAMMNQPDFETADLSALKFATIAGARCSPKVLKAWNDKGVQLRQAYGMTEVIGFSTINSAAGAMAKPESCGRGYVFSKHRVVSAEGRDCAPGELGEILVQSPAMASGYWNNEEATQQSFRNGWFHTGDLGMLDESGDLQIVDRLKDLIISGGYNIAPAELENAIASVEGVEEVCVIAVPDEKFGESPAAIVYGSPELSPERIAQEIQGKLARYKLPKHITVASDPLPRMASGKIARRNIREHFGPEVEAGTPS